MQVTDATSHRVRRTERVQGVEGVGRMATSPNTTREAVNEATSEAIRATSEASRRTLQSAQDAMRTTRAYMVESTEANRKLFSAYARGVEAAIRAFCASNAARKGASIPEAQPSNSFRLASVA